MIRYLCIIIIIVVVVIIVQVEKACCILPVFLFMLVSTRYPQEASKRFFWLEEVDCVLRLSKQWRENDADNACVSIDPIKLA